MQITLLLLFVPLSLVPFGSATVAVKGTYHKHVRWNTTEPLYEPFLFAVVGRKASHTFEFSCASIRPFSKPFDKSANKIDGAFIL